MTDSELLWVAVEVPCEEEKVAVRVDDGNADALAVAEAVGVRGAVAVGLDVVDGDTVPVNAQPSARWEMFGAHG